MKNPNLFLLGNSSKGPGKDYSLPSDTQSRIFGIFNAIAIIATTYGNGIIPEIQEYQMDLQCHLHQVQMGLFSIGSLFM